MSDTSSLSALRAIEVPSAPPFFPPAPEFWLMIAMVSLIAIFAILAVCSHRRKNAYRRAGLVLLEGVRTEHDVSVLLKRVALAAYPRETVASITGRDWVQFLEVTFPATRLEALLDPSEEQPASVMLIESAAEWIKGHRTLDDQTYGRGA